MATADPDRKRFRRTARHVANLYVNGAIDRAACIRRLYDAAEANGIPGARPSDRAEWTLVALLHGAGDIEPGLFPRHLDRLAANLDATAYAAAVKELLHRLRRAP